MRYINITAIDIAGSPRSTQVMTKEATDSKRIMDILDEWADHDYLIAAFVYDTESKILTRYDVKGVAFKVVA